MDVYTGIDIAAGKKQWQLEAKKIAHMSGVGKPML